MPLLPQKFEEIQHIGKYPIGFLQLCSREHIDCMHHVLVPLLRRKRMIGLHKVMDIARSITGIVLLIIEGIHRNQEGS